MSAKKLSDKYRTWIEIDSSALAHNYHFFRKRIAPKVKVMGVVKSNAYGHNLFLIAKFLSNLGADGLCVDSVVEGFALRREGITVPLLVIGPTLPLHLEEAATRGITVSVSEFATLGNLLKATTCPEFHIKVDTGMHRRGFYVKDLPRVISFIKSHRLTPFLTGIYTHFASAKDASFPDYTNIQAEEFSRALRLFSRAGFKNLMRHAAATGGTLLHPDYHFDAVRIGIGLYGLPPSGELAFQMPDVKLSPVLSWRAVVSELKILKKGDYVGYDLTEQVTEKTTIAILPIGYWHGFDRTLSGRGEVLLRGKRARVLGRVSMDLLVVDVTGISCKVGDAATIIGQDGRDEITAMATAEKANTSSYEFITRLNPLIERVLI